MEVEQLRIQYDLLCKKKQAQQTRKMRNTTPTNAQVRLYEEGRRKLQIERSRNDRDTRNTSLSKRDASPIPVCNRLYEQGMNKVLAEKLPSTTPNVRARSHRRCSSRNPSPIPVCNRLYEEGMHKLRPGTKDPVKRAEGSKSRRRYSVSPLPICDRLYEEGMAKKTERKGKIAPNGSSDSSTKTLSYATSKTHGTSSPTSLYSTEHSSQGYLNKEIITMPSPHTRDPSPLPHSE